MHLSKKRRTCCGVFLGPTLKGILKVFNQKQKGLFSFCRQLLTFL
jgi:hypothetical protein